MQVNNNYSSPNFGMALRIKPEAMESLKKAPMKTLETLERIGNDLKDTKYYHMEILENLEPRITSPYANKYRGFFDIQPTDKLDKLAPSNFLNFNTVWDGTEIYGYKKGQKVQEAIQYASNEAAFEAYRRIKTAPTSLERVAMLTKELDNREIERVTQEKANKELTEAIENKANDLFSKFGSKDAE